MVGSDSELKAATALLRSNSSIVVDWLLYNTFKKAPTHIHTHTHKTSHTHRDRLVVLPFEIAAHKTCELLLNQFHWTLLWLAH